MGQGRRVTPCHQTWANTKNMCGPQRLVNECRNVTCHTSRTLGHLRTLYEYAVSSEDESVMGAKRYVVDLWRLKKRRCEVATCYFALCSFR